CPPRRALTAGRRSAVGSDDGRRPRHAPGLTHRSAARRRWAAGDRQCRIGRLGAGEHADRDDGIPRRVRGHRSRRCREVPRLASRRRGRPHQDHQRGSGGDAGPRLDVATLTALVDGADQRGLLTIAHAVTAASFDRGLDAGVDVLTHTPSDRPLPKLALNRLRESATAVSPTLVMTRAIIDGRLGDRADAALGLALVNVRAMDEASIAVIAGTDANETAFAPVPHGPSLHTELDWLVQAGMSRAEALRAATSAAADALGLRDRGRVVEGARADLLLIDGDPLTD